MNKNELIAAVAEKSALSKKDAEKAVSAFVSTVTDALSKGDKVHLLVLARSKSRNRGARKGHNPLTGAEIDIPASKAPAFKAGKALKDALNRVCFHGLTDLPKKNGGSFFLCVTIIGGITRTLND